jgi:hypothetical protein
VEKNDDDANIYNSIINNSINNKRSINNSMNNVNNNKDDDNDATFELTAFSHLQVVPTQHFPQGCVQRLP